VNNTAASRLSFHQLYNANNAQKIGRVSNNWFIAGDRRVQGFEEE
jgi:hypothetical protein